MRRASRLGSPKLAEPRAVDVLLLSSLYDFSTDLVCEALRKIGVTYLRINRETIAAAKFRLDPVNALAYYEFEGNRWECGSRLRSVWYRQPIFLRNTPGVALSLDEQLSRSQWSAMLRGLTVFDEAFWINHPRATYLAESKPYQLRCASKLGFLTPSTLMTNDASAPLKQKVGDPFILKSVDTVLLREGDDQLFTYSSIVSVADVLASEFQSAPSTCQELLRPKLDLRVTVLAGKAYCIAVTKGGAWIDGDWRLISKDDLAYTDYILDPIDKERCVALVKNLGLQYGAIDLALTPHGTYFIEINPTGEWGWLDAPLRPIANDIAQLLVESR